MTRWAKGLRDENGALMIEGIIVYGITMMLLFLVLAIYSVLYQRWNIQTIANESAAKVAQTFKYQKSDIVTGEIDVSTMTSIHAYRYLTNEPAWMRASKDRAVAYAKERLARTSFVRQLGDPVVSATVEADGLSRRHVVITISGSYEVPAGAALAYFGFPGTIVYSTSGYAECLDLSDYIATTGFVGRISDPSWLGSGVVDALDSAVTLLDDVFSKVLFPES